MVIICKEIFDARSIWWCNYVFKVIVWFLISSTLIFNKAVCDNARRNVMVGLSGLLVSVRSETRIFIRDQVSEGEIG